jgi:signal transduction histidine kinase
MLRSLNTRLLLSYVAVILVCLTLVGLGLLLFVRTSPLWNRATALQLEAAARATMPLLPRPGSEGALTPDQLQLLLEQAAEAQGVRTLLLDENGTVLFDSAGTWTGSEFRWVARRARLSRGPRISGALTLPSGPPWTFVGEVIPDSRGARQIVLFTAPQSRLVLLAWFGENLLPPLIRAGAVALVLSALLALLISRSVAAPLKRVAQAAAAIAQGQIGARAPLSGPTEARSLAHSFNVMAAEVEATQQAQRDFIANVSHELKTPLTAIQGFSQALLDGTAGDPEAARRAAQVIHEEADRMRGMVNELLTLARFDAGQVQMARQRVALQTLLEGCVERLAPQAQAAQVHIDLEAPERVMVVGDRERLAQVFTNLLDNAVAHTPAGGSVRVRVPPPHEAGYVEIAVKDTGSGIPPEALSRIFERFYQVDPSRQRSRGAGLGLAITQEIVEAHGGTITVESVEGEGTTFLVRLPTTRTAPEP